MMAEDESDQKRLESIIAEAVKVWRCEGGGHVIILVLLLLLTEMNVIPQAGEVSDFGSSSSSSSKKRRSSKKKTSEAAEAEALLKAIQVMLLFFVCALAK